MKRILVILSIMAASFSHSNAAFSDEYKTGLPDEYGLIKSFEQKSQKDECLIVARNCIGEVESIDMRVERLKREIDKGSAVYTPEELKSFQNQLNWINSENAAGYEGG